MTDYVPTTPPEEPVRAWNEPAPDRVPDPVQPAPAAARLPFSQAAVWGFVLSCVSIFILGFVGALGAAISARGFRAARQGTARGRGLAIAGMIIGAAGFLYYAVNFIVHRML
jgi:hypothetical protein